MEEYTVALLVTFLAGVLSVFVSRWLFRTFASPLKAALPSAAEATSAASETATTEQAAQTAAQPWAIAVTTDATTESRGVGTGGSPLVSGAAARSLAKQASMSRSRAAIQVLNEAADMLRAQGDVLAAAVDDDDAPPSPEPAGGELQTAAAVAVQRFLSRKLSRQASHVSSSSVVAVQRSSVEALGGGGPADTAGSVPDDAGGALAAAVMV